MMFLHIIMIELRCIFRPVALSLSLEILFFHTFTSAVFGRSEAQGRKQTTRGPPRKADLCVLNSFSPLANVGKSLDSSVEANLVNLYPQLECLSELSIRSRTVASYSASYQNMA